MNDGTYIGKTLRVKLLGFNISENQNFIHAGFTDAYIEVQKNTTHATYEGEIIALNDATIVQGKETFISVDDLETLLGDQAKVNMTRGKLNIVTPMDAEDYGFPEDANLDDLTFNPDGDLPVLSSSTANNILATAKQYIGVPYYFGAPTGTTRVFDCSSFTQFVFKKHGVSLPRVARDQAKLGTYVPTSQLKPGDLLFFYWPGRFESNKIVGHVGIYMGNGYMIHSAPKTTYSSDGVQIANLRTNKGYRGTYLGAKRIGS